jgi:serine/threonine protein phosphatase 1
LPRKIVIGDIHGALKALEQLLERMKPGKTDELIFVGDYVDGWSESAQTIDYLLRLQKINHCIFIKGNHDAWCEEWLKGEEADEEWVKHGGQETIDSYSNYNQTQKGIHLSFLKTMPYWVTDKKNRLFVHAGFSSLHGPEGEHFDSNFFWDRTLWELALATDKYLDRNSRFFPRRLQIFKEIFIGHTPTTNYYIDIPMKAQNVWNVDTGAAFKGRLTAMDVETKQFWQSDPVWQLYPNERGRNK